MGLPGDLNEQAKQFISLHKESGLAVIQDKLIAFISHQAQRAERKEISRATIPTL
jgi:hypothetical protein